VQYGWIFLRVTPYFDKPLLSNEFKTYIIEKDFTIKYEVLENCVTNRGVRLYVFNCPRLTRAIFSISWIIMVIKAVVDFFLAPLFQTPNFIPEGAHDNDS